MAPAALRAHAKRRTCPLLQGILCNAPAACRPACRCHWACANRGGATAELPAEGTEAPSSGHATQLCEVLSLQVGATAVTSVSHNCVSRPGCCVLQQRVCTTPPSHPCHAHQVFPRMRRMAPCKHRTRPHPGDTPTTLRPHKQPAVQPSAAMQRWWRRPGARSLTAARTRSRRNMARPMQHEQPNCERGAVR